MQLVNPWQLQAELSQRLRWPLPALAVWSLAWALYGALTWLGISHLFALGLSMLLSMLARGLGATRMRRNVISLGFPLSYLGLGLQADAPPWLWLVLLAALLCAYPWRAWNDAPMFPTPAGGLNALPALLPLPAQAHVLDAGCGLGDGLLALRQAYPQARFSGVEWSWPLALLARRRCAFAQVQRGDMWAQDWGHFDLVYLFQRPESMARALHKARTQMRAGSWLVSLEFAAEPLADVACSTPQGKPVWGYRIAGTGAGPEGRQAKVSRRPADKTG